MYYKYLSPDRFDVMCNLKIRFTQPGALNDPFEDAPLIKYENTEPYFLILTENKRKVIPNSRKEEPAKLGQQLKEHLNYAVGILSLSRTRKNQLLWSHYADSHRDEESSSD